MFSREIELPLRFDVLPGHPTYDLDMLLVSKFPRSEIHFCLKLKGVLSLL